MRDAPLITFLLITSTVLVFLLQLGSQAISGQDTLLAFGAKQNDLIREGELWRFITPILLHGSFSHLGFNLFLLLVLGIDLEFVFGRAGLVLLYFLGGFAGYVFSFLLSSNLTVGASTAIYGLLGAQSVNLFRNRITDRRAYKFLAIVIFVVLSMLISAELPALEIWSHLGGMMGGMMFAWFAIQPKGGEIHYRDLVGSAAVVTIIFCILAAIGMWFPFE